MLALNKKIIQAKLTFQNFSIFYNLFKNVYLLLRYFSYHRRGSRSWTELFQSCLKKISQCHNSLMFLNVTSTEDESQMSVIFFNDLDTDISLLKVFHVPSNDFLLCEQLYFLKPIFDNMAVTFPP